MKQYKDGVDFIIVSFKLDYIRLLVESIKKYVKGIPYTIHVVVNYINKDEIDKNIQYFKNNKNVIVHEGIDQSSDTNISTLGQYEGNNVPRRGKIDNSNTLALSWIGSQGINIGIKKGNRKYVCVMDHDAIFLDSCIDELIKLTKTYCFISNRWDPGSLFKEANNAIGKFGMARPMLFFSKRKLYDDIESEKYVEKGIWTYSPWTVDYRDTGGNITWYVQQKNKPFMILQNSYWTPLKRDRYNIKNIDVDKWHHFNELNLSADTAGYTQHWAGVEHVLDFSNKNYNWTNFWNEQAWLNDRPIFFHFGRGGSKDDTAMKWWVKVAGEYLGLEV